MVRNDRATAGTSSAGGQGLWLLLSQREIVDSSAHVKEEWVAWPSNDALLVFLSARDWERFGPAAVTTLREVNHCRPRFDFLLSRESPPELGVRQDDEVESYACSLSVYRLIRGLHRPAANLSAYQAGFAVLNSEVAPVELRCLQFSDPLAEPPRLNEPFPRCEWIIPHRGNIDHLSTCLDSVSIAAAERDIVSVCFDEEITERHAEITRRFPRFQYFRSRPSGYGPYVGRERLCQASRAEYLIFQDSDDVSCVGRREVLLSHLMQRELDWIGGHELRVDEVSEKVLPFRFPIDVSHALSIRAGHPLLFPTSMIRRAALLQAGGFSTHRKFGSDTEFLLRAFVNHLKIGNVDEFLYVRRKRAGSLTTAPETALDSPVRQVLDRTWKNDFAAIKRGELALPGSSLEQAHHPDYCQITIDPMHEL